jgi:hypothetical protein
MWDWQELRAELPGLARAWLPCNPGDPIGPGLAIDETAQLKDGDATACVAPQHAGCTGHVENWVTTVFAAYVTTSGQAWADFDVFMPGRWDKDLARRGAAGIPDRLGRKTKPQLAEDQLERLLKAGLPARWAAFDEVYGRSGALRGACEAAGLAYVAVIPRDFRITLPSGAVIKAEAAVKDAVFERRSCGSGSKGPRYADWALAAAASPRHHLLIRRLLSRPDSLTFYLCWAPPDQPATMTFFVTIAGGAGPTRKRSRPERTRSAGTSLRRAPGTRSAGTLPWPPSPSSAMSPSATPCAATSPSRLRQPPAATTTPLETATGTITADATTGTTPTTLTWASPSATRPSPPGPGNPARPISAPSGSPSPRPPA